MLKSGSRWFGVVEPPADSKECIVLSHGTYIEVIISVGVVYV